MRGDAVFFSEGFWVKYVGGKKVVKKRSVFFSWVNNFIFLLSRRFLKMEIFFGVIFAHNNVQKSSLFSTRKKKGCLVLQQ